MNVHVSSLSKYEFCPRSIYLEEVAGLTPKPTEEKEKGIVGHAIRKELSLRQAKVLGKVSDASELKHVLMSELESILEDVPRIYREKLFLLDYGKYVNEMRPQITREIELMAEKLSELVKEVGLKRALEKITPHRVEYTIRSDSLGLTGRIDKLMLVDDGGLTPVEIKTGTPSEGVWSGDQLQVCGYVLLCEEKFNQKIRYGYVEYTQICEKKPVLASEALRRKTLETRDKVLEIRNGLIPEICPHGSGRKCDACGLKEECYTV